MRKLLFALTCAMVFFSCNRDANTNKKSIAIDSTHYQYCEIKLPTGFVLVEDTTTKIYYIQCGEKFFCDEGSFGYRFTEFKGGEPLFEPTPYVDSCLAKQAIIYRIGQTSIPTRLKKVSGVSHQVTITN